MTAKDIHAYHSYAFVFGHPDDEMYTTGLIKLLVDAGKKVSLVYVTSGNYRGEDTAAQRKQEVAEVATLLGVDANNLYLLDYPERQLKNCLPQALAQVQALIQDLHIGGVITHDYEGGHSVHDFTNFCSAMGAQHTDADLWVFPSYHNQPSSRVWNQFILPKENDTTIRLTAGHSELKATIFATHVTQQAFFKRLPSPDKQLMLHREIFRHITEAIDYTKQPTQPIGYDFEGSPTKFSEFLAATKDLV